MSQWTIGKKVFAGVAVLTAMIAGTMFLGLWNTANLNSRMEQATGPVASQIHEADETLLKASQLCNNALEAVLAGYQKDPTKVNSIQKQSEGEVADLEKSIDKLGLVVDEDSERQEVAGVKAALEKWKNAFVRLKAALDAGRLSEADAIAEGDINAAAAEIEKLSKAIADGQYQQMNESRIEAGQTYHTARWLMAAMTMLALLTVLAVVWLVRGINLRLRQTAVELFEAAEQTSHAASQVSSSSQSLAQGSSEQAASLEETSASSEQISSMAKRNSENSNAAADLVTDSQQKFTETNRSLDQMVAAMGEINTSSDKISKIIKVIDEIAFQTNILALNAAVEAARAGEAGMGFAVVADEVRNLAQRCSQAAKDTAQLIEESISNANDGKRKMDQVATAVRVIDQQAGKIKTLVDEVNLGSQQQAQGIDQIGKAISQMEQVTQSTAASAEESASAAEQLNAQSVALKNIVEQLTVMVGGGASALHG